SFVELAGKVGTRSSPSFRRWSKRARSLQTNQRFGPAYAAHRAQGGRIHVDPLLDDPSVAQAELVDAAPVDSLAAGGTRGLPFDDSDVAARRPIQELPYVIWGRLADQLGEPSQLLAGYGPVVER